MDSFIIFCFVLLGIGFILIIVSFVLLCIGKVYVHSGHGDAVEFEGPWHIKLKTNRPLVFTLLIGALLVVYPLYEIRKDRDVNRSASGNIRTISINCKSTYPGSKDLRVYAAIAKDSFINGEATMYIPVSEDTRIEAVCFKKDSNEPFARKPISIIKGEDTYVWDVPPPPETEDLATEIALPPVRLDAAVASNYQK